jgi:GxxExxY protein
MEDHNYLSRIIVDAAFHVHFRLGPGLLETVYEAALTHELKNRKLFIDRQTPIPVFYDGIKFDEGFRADIIVNQMIIVELKSVEKIAPVHRKQLLTYLRLTNKRLGLLINFGEALIKDGITRMVNGL